MTDLFYDHDEEREADEDESFSAQESVAVDKQKISTSLALMGMAGHEVRFLDMINGDSMPHALIFHGPKGVGKCTFALRLARTLLAHVQNPVDTGPSLFGDPVQDETKLAVFDVPSTHPVAQRMASGGHPDFLMIGGEGEDDEKSKSGQILIDSARKVSTFLHMSAGVSGGWRVVVIDNAERLNIKAQNALLKILEEPPARTLLILVTHQIGRLLPTIRSRAQSVRFHPLSDENFKVWMKRASTYVSGDDLHWIQQLSQNCPGQAQTLIDLEAPQLIAEFLSIWSGYPQFDEQAWMDYAEKRTSTDEGGFPFILSFWQWWLDAMIRAKADAAYASSLFNLVRHEPTQQLIAGQTLQDLIAMRDAIAPIFDRTLAVALEKRQALFSARMCMMPQN